jgi:hypothetical protein
LPFLLRGLEDQQDLLAAPQAKAGDQSMAAFGDALRYRLGQTLFFALAIRVQTRAIGRFQDQQITALNWRRQRTQNRAKSPASHRSR